MGTDRENRKYKRADERALLGIVLRGKKSNGWMKERTQVGDFVERIRCLKRNWSAHVSRHMENW